MTHRLHSVCLISALVGALLLPGCGGSGRGRASPRTKRPSTSSGSGAAGPGPGGAGQLLQTRLFSTIYPAGWHSTVVHNRRITLYLLGSPGARVSDLGIPTRGGIGITVSYVPASAVGTRLPNAATAAPIDLLNKLVGVPVPAAAATLVSAPHAAMLGGVPAAAAGVRYTYHGVPNLQENLVTRQSATVVFVELDTQPSERSAGEAALQTVLGNWRWLNPAASAI